MHMFLQVLDDGRLTVWSRPYRQLQRYHYHHDLYAGTGKAEANDGFGAAKKVEPTLYLENSGTSLAEFMNRFDGITLNSNLYQRKPSQIYPHAR